MAFEKITEKSSLYHNLEEKSIGELLHDMNNEDRKVPIAVGEAIPAIEKLVSANDLIKSNVCLKKQIVSAFCFSVFAFAVSFWAFASCFSRLCLRASRV